MNKTQKLMGLAAALAFAMVMLPAAAFADTTQYDLFVNGEQFTSEKLTIECGEGTATYDPLRTPLRLITRLSRIQLAMEASPRI